MVTQLAQTHAQTKVATTIERTWTVVIPLTVIYLIVELGFNAKLLDVVGSAANLTKIHQIENIGRALSGVAVALFVLQLMIKRFSLSALTIACVISGLATFLIIDRSVDTLVKNSSLEFRRSSATLVLMQRGLVNGHLNLYGLNDKPEIFSQPQGKAFLALFPAMASAVNQLDNKLEEAKRQATIRIVEKELGGAAGYYDNVYVRAVKEISKNFESYRLTPDVSAAIDSEHEKSWNEYLTTLGKRGWTPSSVPEYAYAKVARDVARKVGTPEGWNLHDELVFKQAVARKVRKRMSDKGIDKETIKIKGSTIPLNLDWRAFFLHPVVQETLREKMKISAKVIIKPAYDGTTMKEFESVVYQSALKEIVDDRMKMLTAELDTFADGGKNYKAGLDAVATVIIPPIALGLSLFGAIAHGAKLIYLLLKVWMPKRNGLWRVPLIFIGLSLLTFSSQQNDITKSRLFGQLMLQVATPLHGDSASFIQIILPKAYHIISVGQGHMYPFNHAISRHIFPLFLNEAETLGKERNIP